MKTMLSFRKLTVFALSLLLFTNLPVGFGKNALKKKYRITAIATDANLALTSMYNQLSLDSLGLSREAFMAAISGFQKLKGERRLLQDDIITIIDFSLSSTKKRMFVVDFISQKLLFNTYVAHGVNSGKEFANRFSNIPSSLQSSLGFYETTHTYEGKHGYSLQLNGLEKGINDNVDKRAIVIHGAPYVSEGFIRQQGFLGRSWGCPAIPEKYVKPIIDRIKQGSCLFIYANDRKYLHQSKLMEG